MGRALRRAGDGGGLISQAGRIQWPPGIFGWMSRKSGATALY
jgi:hypothetical protein